MHRAGNMNSSMPLRNNVPASSSKSSMFSIENILNSPTHEPQEIRKIEPIRGPAPRGLNTIFPIVVPPMLPQPLRPPVLDYSLMLPHLHVQSPVFDDMLVGHPLPGLSMGFPRQAISGLQRRKRFMRKPKQRPLFAHSQIQRLEKEFGEEKYLTEAKRAELSKDLGMTETQVKTWYQNRRTKWRKELKEEMNAKAKTEDNSGTKYWQERGGHVDDASTMLTAFERAQSQSSSSFTSKLQDARMFIDLETVKPRFVYS